MKNKDRLLNRLSTISSFFKEELDYYLYSVDHEDENYNLVDAFEDFDNLVYSDLSKRDPRYKEMNNILREIGFAIPINLKDHIVLGGSKESLVMFRYNKQPYAPVSSWESWINK
jgi:hypothetical protein